MADTKTKILDYAEGMTQTRGFNGFSYLDVAAEIGIKTASIHYHFKHKDDLAVALVERIRVTHASGFREIEASTTSPKKRLESLIEYFQGSVREGKFCLCGMMAAELQSVSPRVSTLVDAYFKDVQTWLARQFKEAGYKDSKLRALRFLSALEGSLLLGRLRNDPTIVRNVLKGFFTP